MQKIKTSKNEIERWLVKTRENLDQIQNSVSAEELRTSWEDFLSSFSRAIGKLISAGIKNQSSRSWAYRLKNRSTKDDDGLVYLREARNALEHGLVPFAKFVKPSTVIGGSLFHVEGNSSLAVTNCTFDGVKVNDFSFTTKNGKPSSIIGNPNLPIEVRPTNILLVPIISDEKKATYEVPSNLAGKELDGNSPASLAQAGLEELERLFEEYKAFGQV